MTIIELLELAIKEKRQISYEYELEGRAIGTRYGDPHAIFISSRNNINIDIYKQDGVCTNPGKKIPDWRQYTVKHIRNVTILENSFTQASGYNPNSSQYSKIIIKI